MQSIVFRPLDPQRDFAQLAEWFTIIEGEINTAAGLAEYHTRVRERSTVRVIEDEHGERLGFYWALRDQAEPDKMTFDLYVKPEARGKGLGALLFADMLSELSAAPLGQLRVRILENSPEGIEFTRKRGFTERKHLIGMELDLTRLDDRPYDAVITRLQDEGFVFTSMAELGNTEEAQRRLYALNDMTSSETPGSEGEHSWNSFEDFQQSVCMRPWYIPAGQKVVIDSASGEFVAMSAITRFEGETCAYNLHTGVDKRYRGRKIGQAVKITALRFARENLGVERVRTHHNTLNLPMIAIDNKLGYTRIMGNYVMEKTFGGEVEERKV